MSRLLAVALGFFLDLALGDPRWLPHPVVGFGKAISWAEPRLRAVYPDTEAGRRRAGLLLACALPVMAGIVTWAIVLLLNLVSPWLGFALEAWLSYQLLATCELRRQSMAVARALKEEGISAARAALSRIVGRDTAALDAPGVCRAAVETVAENASDGVVAPLLYLVIGGAPLGMAYKAVNTLDSMVGYKNERYLDFGRASAKLDDIANLIPSRITACAMALLAWTVGLDSKGAWRVWLRDRYKSASPNSGQPEAAMAGALGVRLLGPASYFGKLVDKPTIGDDTRQIEGEDIARANRLMLVVAFACLAVFEAVGFCLLFAVQ